MSTIHMSVSPGLWALAWRRLRTDRIAMVSLGIVGLYLLTLLLSVGGLVAADWDAEVGVNYAPPTFLGAPAVEAGAANSAAPVVVLPPPENPLDPLKDIIRELRASMSASAPVVIDYYKCCFEGIFLTV